MENGICFSGGGIKGAAHIGVLKALEEENLHFKYISGTSSGSIVAALYAMEYSSDDIYKLFKKYAKRINYIDIANILKLIYWILFKRRFLLDGLNSGKIIENLIKKECDKNNIKKINEIKNNLFIPSIDLNTGKVYIFYSKNDKYNRRYSDEIIYDNKIDIGRAVRASCSYPGIFSPCIYNKKEFIDGGIRENVPWKQLKENGAKRVMSIIFEEKGEYKKEKNLFDVVGASLGIMSHELANYELEGADFLLKIKTKKVSLLDSRQIDYLYNIGYKTAKENINEIKELFK